MTDSTTKSIDWQKTEARALKIGDRFRFGNRNDQGEIEIFTVMEISREPWTGHDNDRTVRFLIETKTQGFWFQDSDLVLIPLHAQTIEFKKEGSCLI